MPMERETHENLLNELLNADLETSRKTEILQELRTDYDSVLHDFTDMTDRNNDLQKKHDDLVVSNSKLFREIGVAGQPEQEEIKEKEFSETITIEDIEKQSNY